jgi:hypothetical protein
MDNPGQIFTTLGWLDAKLVALKETVTHDDEHIKLVRIDKYFGGQWVGNDLHGTIKKGHELNIAQEQFS